MYVDNSQNECVSKIWYLENKQIFGKAPSMCVIYSTFFNRKIGDLITDSAKLGPIFIADLIDYGQTFSGKRKGVRRHAVRQRCFTTLDITNARLKLFSNKKHSNSTKKRFGETILLLT